ncbi:MAG: shikimate dehydrogenase [Syntrophorhabdaceae bacterium]|nr:shikimate dehydrogenase [Syntrophorhabdaceae bacterium]
MSVSLLFVVGHPIKHSLSPAMHNGVIFRLGLPLVYIPVELQKGRLRTFLRIVRESNFLGGNVTIPFKEEAAALSDTRSEVVEACGAANTLVVRDGRLFAENTDGEGFLDALAMRGWGRKHSNVVLIGAGGAARGVAFALGKAGACKIILLNRSLKRADDVARTLSRCVPSTSFSTGGIDAGSLEEAFRDADLIVQCTPRGLVEEWSDFPCKTVKKNTYFADLVYRAKGTSIVRKLRARGIPSMDGLPMLACQAARSFALWTGKSPGGELFLSFADKSLKNMISSMGFPKNRR